MQIFRGLHNIPKDTLPCSLTIGNFDGIHKGHRQIIENVVNRAKEKGLKSAILTFADHPIKLFRPNHYDHFLIFSLAQKLKFLKQFNLDYVFILPFNRKIANISANNFVKDILVDDLKMQDLVIGYDFIFGKDREGDFNFLKDKSKELDFGLTKNKVVLDNDKAFSSTRIRSLIKNGKILETNKALDKDFEVEGLVIEGKKNGKKFGFPTSNLNVKKHLLMPKFGVYKSDLVLDGKVFKSVTNFGVRPSIDDEKKPLFETHILDYSGDDLYGKKVVVKLKEFIRDEKKFESLEELKAAIRRDVECARELD